MRYLIVALKELNDSLETERIEDEYQEALELYEELDEYEYY